jgi:hypothetical protein
MIRVREASEIGITGKRVNTPRICSQRALIGLPCRIPTAEILVNIGEIEERRNVGRIQ